MGGEFVVGYVRAYVVVHITNATLEILVGDDTSGSHEPWLLSFTL